MLVDTTFIAPPGRRVLAVGAYGLPRTLIPPNHGRRGTTTRAMPRLTTPTIRAASASSGPESAGPPVPGMCFTDADAVAVGEADDEADAEAEPKSASTIASWMWMFSYTPTRFELPGPMAVRGTSSAVWLVVVQSIHQELLVGVRHPERSVLRGPPRARFVGVCRVALNLVGVLDREAPRLVVGGHDHERLGIALRVGLPDLDGPIELLPSRSCIIIPVRHADPKRASAPERRMVG